MGLVPVVTEPAAHRLSADQIASFDRTGYLVLRDRVPRDLLAGLRRAADPWLRDGLRPEPLGDDEHELRVAHGVHTPGTFCSAGDVAAVGDR